MRDMMDFGGPGMFNARNLIAGALAVVFVLGAWFGLRTLLADDAEPPPPPPPAAEPEQAAEAPPPEEPEEVEEDGAAYPVVLVAKQRIAAGELLAQSSMDWRQWRQPIEAQSAFVKDDGFFLRSDDAESEVESLFGAVARSPIEAGTPIYRNAIIAPGFPGFITAVLAPGHRAVTINVTGTATSSEVIHPGDRVDVILFYPPGAAGPAVGPVAQAIASDVRVLAVGRRVLQARQQDQFGANEAVAPAAAGEPFTLEVPSAEVERIVLAASTGQLDLALRSTSPLPEGNYSDVPSGLVSLDDFVPPPPTPPEEAAALVRVIRGDSGASDEAALFPGRLRFVDQVPAEGS